MLEQRFKQLCTFAASSELKEYITVGIAEVEVNCGTYQVQLVLTSNKNLWLDDGEVLILDGEDR